MASLSAIMDQMENPMENDNEEEGSSNHLLLDGHSLDDNNSLDYHDFSLGEDEEGKDDYFDDDAHYDYANHGSNNNDGPAWVQLLNLPPTNHGMTPVGGMRRVSSCYFSIASNLSAGDYHSTSATGANHNRVDSPNLSNHNSNSMSGTLSFDGRDVADFLLHDVLMNVFSFLDAHSLAAFSETGRRPNFECFYFLELQLQRALLMGEGHSNYHNAGDDGLSDVKEGSVTSDDDNLTSGIEGEVQGGIENNSLQDNELVEERDGEGNAESENDPATSNSNNNGNNSKKCRGRNALPSFDGSIIGTGVVSRLASLDPTSARKIVQTYLDSNASIQSMPLRHSLAYFRQVLLRGQSSHHSSLPFPQPPNIPDSVAKNARNMALFFTFLGAAYMHAQQGAGGDGMPMPPTPHMPDPSDVLTEENVEALKNMMLKVGLAGGFFKAGKTMKERVVAEQRAQQVNAAVVAGRNRAERSNFEREEEQTTNALGEGDMAGRGNQAGNESSVQEAILQYQSTSSNEAASVNDSAANAANAAAAQHRHSSQQRSSSIGSLEDLSHIISHPSAIASRLYNAFANSNNNSIGANNSSSARSSHPPTSQAATSNLVTSSNEDEPQQQGMKSLPRRHQIHRSKRSHKTLRHLHAKSDDGLPDDERISGRTSSEEEKKSSEPDYHLSSSEEQKTQEDSPLLVLPEEMAHAIDHPISPNPYDHPSSLTFDTTTSVAAKGAAGCKEGQSKGNTTVASEVLSFFTFNTTSSPESAPAMMLPLSNGNVPTGCIGAYAYAVRAAASEVTRLSKAKRKSNFDALPPDEQRTLGIRFIDACTSDTKLHIVKDILQNQRCMDVDRFFVGTDDTETCALHAAAFNGAERVLEFLCGGIDERDPDEDGGLCDVDVRDANGWTALHFAAGANSVTSVRVLSSHGAKLTIEASNGYTPFHWAERLSNEEVATELERLGADNRFVGRWMFGGRVGVGGSAVMGGGGDDRRIPFVSFLANRFFALSGR